MEYKVKSATQEDAAWIKDLYKQEKKHIGSFNLYQVWENYLAGIGPHRFIKVDEVAFCNYGFSVRKNCYVIHDIAVHLDHKGKGIGGFILEKIAAKAHREGTTLMLKCNFDNEEGNAFYKRKGMKLERVNWTKAGVKQNVWRI
jgi:GNAT superfamily N-acetyltransferase